MSKFELQVDKSHYFNTGYNHQGRWLSFFHQIRLATEKEPKNILEIGPGNGWVARILKDFDIDTKTVDIDAELNPDYCAHIDNLPIEDNTFDIVCAYEVLEHLPFDTFVTNLKEMARVSNKYIMISLPDHRRTLVSFSLKVPFIKTLRMFIKIPSFKKHEFDGQHYWEIGKVGYSPKVIRDAIAQSGLILEKSFVPQDTPMNHYFVMRKK